MANPNPAQKSHFTHAEQHEPDLDATEWVSLTQRMMDYLPPDKKDPKYLHIAAGYDPDKFDKFDEAMRELAVDLRNVSFPPSRSGANRQIGDMPAGKAWGGPHKGTGFDPMPNKAEWAVF
jgi:hypothetical protein